MKLLVSESHKKSTEKVSKYSKLSVGAVIRMPDLVLEVTALNGFIKSPFFPDAVAEARKVKGGWLDGNCHISTPWGYIKVVQST